MHLTAEEVFAEAREVLPEISLATVYNTLNERAELGEVLKLSGNTAVRYDPNVEGRHQHLVCDRCGAMRDVHPIGERSLGLPESERAGFDIRGIEVVFRGLCPACQPQREGATARDGRSAP